MSTGRAEQWHVTQGLKFREFSRKKSALVFKIEAFCCWEIFFKILFCKRKTARKIMPRSNRMENQTLKKIQNLFFTPKPSADVNPLHPLVSIHILHTVLGTYFIMPIRRICLTIKSFLVGDHFFYSCNLCVWFKGDIVRRN